jgi:hypothetical protein
MLYTEYRIQLFPTKEQESKFTEFIKIYEFVYDESLRYAQTTKVRSQSDLYEHIKTLKPLPEYAFLNSVPYRLLLQATKDCFIGNREKSYKCTNLHDSFYYPPSAISTVDDTHITLLDFDTPIKVSETKPLYYLGAPRVFLEDSNWYLGWNSALKSPVFNYKRNRNY